MDFYDSLNEDERIARESVRSAVVLAKLRYNEQLAPFVKNDPERLSSTLVQTELERIVAECSREVGAEPKSVYDRFSQILAEVVLPVSEPEKQSVTDLSDEPPKNNTTEKPGPVNKVGDPGTTTDVKDHGVVLEEEILNPDYSKTIDVQGSCFRCEEKVASEDSPLCEDCESIVLKEAGAESDFLERKEAYPYSPTPNSPNQMGQNQGLSGPQQPLTPLNPNAPYQCNVCGYTGTFADVSNHINTATDPQHLQAKNQQHVQQTQTQPTQMAANVKEADADAYEDDVHQDEVKIPEQTTNPVNRFQEVVQTMANRAAARYFSTPQDATVKKVADMYGLDSDQLKQSLFLKATFGDYSYTNGQPGDEPAPDGYTPLNLDADAQPGTDAGHEVVVPVSPAIRRVADDLGMDENTVYASVKDDMGADLSNDYHVSAQGSYEVFVPSEVMDQATNHPQPDAPGGEQPNTGQPGTAVQPVQPMQQQVQTNYLGGALPQEVLDVLLDRDEDIAVKRMARRGYLKLR